MATQSPQVLSKPVKLLPLEVAHAEHSVAVDPLLTR